MEALLTSYAFLFPFEKVPQGAKIVIYGAGKLGQEYVKQLLLTQYCELVALADRNYASYQGWTIPVIAPAQVHAQNFDCVVLAQRSENVVGEIISMLEAQGISHEKIVYQPERKSIPSFMDGGRQSQEEKLHAYDVSPRNLLLYFIGGFGDFIVQKRCVESMLQLAPDLAIDVLCNHGQDFLQFLYQDTPQIRQIDLNLGTRFDREKTRYGAALLFHGSEHIEVGALQEPSPFSTEWRNRFLHLREQTEKEAPLRQMMQHSLISRSIYRGEDCYRHLCYDGSFPYQDHHVHIPQDLQAASRFTARHFGKYLTVNYGNGNVQNTASMSKAWPKEKFNQVVQMLHQQMPGVRVVQVGWKNAERIDNVDVYVLGEDWPDVAQVLAHSVLHIDTEGGLVHLATQLGTKCLVLFGPTQMAYYGYPENINLSAGACHDCYGLCEDINRCVRDLEKPECMDCITPKMVVKAVVDYLEGTEYETIAHRGGTSIRIQENKSRNRWEAHPALWTWTVLRAA